MRGWAHIYMLTVYINLLGFDPVCGLLQATQITINISITCGQQKPEKHKKSNEVGKC